SQYKSNFLANMSHELRTPLNSSLILARLLSENKDGNLTDDQVKFAETIYSAGNDLLDLINDVLDLSKIEAGHVEIRSAPVNVTAITQALRRTFEPIGASKNLRFDVVVESDVPDTIETDAQRLEQVLKNLLSNAFKFTDRGSVTLRVFTDDDSRISFAVKDTGVGIAADKHDFVFEAFRQIDGGSARKHNGTGLGLSISRDLARLLGGTITLRSAVGDGSTFTIDIPRVWNTAEAQPTSTLSAVSPTSTTPARVSTRSATPIRLPRAATPMQLPRTRTPRSQPPRAARSILIVEDDPAFSKLLADTARSLDFEPLLANSADSAFDLALSNHPQAVLLDVRLPDHSGLSVLDRLKRNAQTRHIPVHMISGTDHTRAALAMGAVGYALKPVHVDELRAVLSRLAERIDTHVKRVLVIEDDDVQRNSVKLLLTADGVEVVTASNATEAREHLKALTFDCVVMDLNLPGESGHELLESMAAAYDLSFPPVIVYTGKALTPQDEERLRRYSNSIIVKGARSPERLLDEVTLFLHQVESELPPERQRMLRKSRDREDLFEGRTLLIVEDDVRNIFALSRVLEPRGAHIEIARNGIEALERLQKGPDVDLVLMDVMMPEMDGLECTRRIRQNPKWSSLPIITLTAKAMRDDQEKCLAAGANDYVAKPIDVDKLLSLIRVWMPR
ncbi:MAG TPA: response regulator, partial [Myxococcota bacterium]